MQAEKSAQYEQNLMAIDIMTLFPEMCDGVLSQSIIGRALERGILSVKSHQIRDFTLNRQKQVDDYPYGGGKGMVMNAQPIMDCYRSLCQMRFGAGDCERADSDSLLNSSADEADEVDKETQLPYGGERPYTIYMSPKGSVLTQAKARELSKKHNLCILCGHYEGVDQRVIDEIVDEEISIGDYVLTGGELPALVLIDSVARMLPGVLSEEVCFTDESHFSGLLEHPHYTRPEVWEGKAVPPILLSGHHANIEKWRREESLRVTALRRPDMIKSLISGRNDGITMAALKSEGSEFDEGEYHDIIDMLTEEEIRFLVEVMNGRLRGKEK